MVIRRSKSGIGRKEIKIKYMEFREILLLKTLLLYFTKYTFKRAKIFTDKET